MNRALAYRLKPNAFTGCRRHGCKCNFAKPQTDEGFAPKFDPCVRTISAKVKCIVTDCRLVQGRSIVGYHPEEQSFLKITVEQPFLLPYCMYWLRKESKDPESPCFGCELFEANLKPVVRFLVDLNIVGCGWIDVRGARLTPFAKQKTHCLVECTTNVANITSRPDDPSNTPFKVLALDIECMSIDVNVFPTADKCPVIQVSTMVRIYGQDEKDEKRVFCLLDTENLTATPDAIVSCPNETALFLALYQYILAQDPDILTGYNSNKQVVHRPNTGRVVLSILTAFLFLFLLPQV